MLVDDGVLDSATAPGRRRSTSPTVEVPLSIHALLAARIDRLPAGEQAVLERGVGDGADVPRGARR